MLGRRLALVSACLGVAVALSAPVAQAAWTLQRSTPVEGITAMDVDPSGEQVVVFKGSVGEGIRRYAADGGVLNSWLGSHSATSDIAFDGPNVLTLENQDLGSSYIVGYTRAGQFLGQRAITDPTPPPTDDPPYALTLDVDSHEDVYVGYTDVADDDLIGVQRLAPTGQLLSFWEAAPGVEPGHFASVPSIASTGAGNVFTAEGANRVQRFTDTGALTGGWGQLGGLPGQFSTPTAIATDPAGDVWVGDSGSGLRLQHFRPDGTFVEQISLPAGNAVAVTGIGFDSAGHVYAATGPDFRFGAIYVYGQASTPPPMSPPPPPTNPPGKRKQRATFGSEQLELRDGKIKVKLACEGELACRGKVVLQKKKLRLGSARYRIAAGKAGVVPVKVGRKGKRALAAVTRPRIKISAELLPKGGAKSVAKLPLTLP